MGKRFPFTRVALLAWTVVVMHAPQTLRKVLRFMRNYIGLCAAAAAAVAVPALATATGTPGATAASSPIRHVAASSPIRHVAASSPIRHVVVIYLENHSFDNVLGFW